MYIHVHVCNCIPNFVMIHTNNLVQVVTSAMRGAVLGIGARSPSNSNAINISFGDSGYATALARVFKRVRQLIWHKNSSEPDTSPLLVTLSD